MSGRSLSERAIAVADLKDGESLEVTDAGEKVPLPEEAVAANSMEDSTGAFDVRIHEFDAVSAMGGALGGGVGWR